MIKFLSTKLFLGIGLLYLLFLSCNTRPILRFDFDKDLEDKYTRRLLRQKRVQLDPESGLNNSNAIKVFYEGFEQGSRGLGLMFELPERLEEATLNYAIKFDRDFKFVKSGKILGFAPERKIAGGRKITDDGWSARATFKKNGEVASYVYHQNKPTKWGDGITSEKPVFTPGQFNEVSIYVKLNDPPDLDNGLFEIWVDGEKIISHDDIQYRSVDSDSSLISNFYFSTFHGGNDIEYAPRDSEGKFTIEQAWFDDIEVYKGKVIRSKKD